ncbi:MAG: UDP-2,3-diacylglucosamine diphosphatase [Ignavibacteria bacterium]|nr:UDP-2,3-diacylglucosamine diphosphatase [Ignavibacteria bacterium]
MRTEDQNKIHIDTIIVSDIHLGSEVSRPSQVIDMLQSYKFNRLILLGDIFDDLNFRRLKKEHWNLLSFIRKLSNPDRNTEVIWVEGNHDEGLIDIMSHLMGVKAYKEFSWIYRNRKFLAIHGHQFDRFLNENIIVSAVSSFIYNKIQKYDRENQTISRFIKKKSKGWLRLSLKIADRAIEHCRRQNADVIICGHTHQSLFKKVSGAEYYNTGCWTDIPSSYITIDYSGNIRINEFIEVSNFKMVS